MNKEIITLNKEETIKLGIKLASFLKTKDVVLLCGDLGAGKTTFVSGVAKGLGIEENVISPTFNILKCYFNNKLNLYHIDAYRLESNNVDIGLEEYIDGDGVCFIEWPQFISNLIPRSYIKIEIKNLGEDKRQFNFSCNDEKHNELIKEIKL